MLAELMRLKSTVAIAGTHGKTTTTSMVAALLDAGRVDPTVINGGIINSYGSNARLGASDWMVVEADEIGRLVPASGRHDCGGDQYRPGASRPLRFVRQGEEQLCRVHRERALLWRGGAVHRPPRSAGDHPQGARPPRHHLWFQRAGRRARRGGDPYPGGNRFTVCASAMGVPPDRGYRIADAGRHNVQNALAAVAVAVEMGVPRRSSAPVSPSSAGSSAALPRWARWMA
jgi:UDP-N-acetylmuramate--alanine ligase